MASAGRGTATSSGKITVGATPEAADCKQAGHRLFFAYFDLHALLPCEQHELLNRPGPGANKIGNIVPTPESLCEMVVGPGEF